MQHAMRMRHIVICGLSGSIIFFRIISQMARFSGGGRGWIFFEHELFLISLQRLSETFLILRRIQRHTFTNVKNVFEYNTCYFVRFLMNLEFSQLNFEKYSNIQVPRKSVQWKPNCFMQMDR